MLKWKRQTAILMTAAMIITMPGAPVFAEEAGMSGGQEYTEDGYESAEEYGCGHDENRYTDSNCVVRENKATSSDSKKIRTVEYSNLKNSTSVAEVGGVEYATMSDAIKAASDGGTVELLTDAEKVNISAGTFTLDLNGRTVDNLTISGTGSPTITDSTNDMAGLVKEFNIAKDSTGNIEIKDFRLQDYYNRKNNRPIDILSDGYSIYHKSSYWLAVIGPSSFTTYPGAYEVIPAITEIQGEKEVEVPYSPRKLPGDLSFRVSDKVEEHYRDVQIKWYQVGSDGTQTLLATETRYSSVKDDGSFVYSKDDKVTFEDDFKNAAIGTKFENVVAEVTIFNGIPENYPVTTILRGYSFTIGKPSIEDTVITAKNSHTDDMGRFIVFPDTNSAKATTIRLDFDVNLGDKLLEKDVDYEIVDDSNYGANAGTYTLKIRGIGEYSGTKEFTWTIVPHRLGMPLVSAIIRKAYDGTTTVTPGVGNFASEEEALRWALYDVKMKEGKDYRILSADFDSSDAGDDKVLTIKIELLNPNYIFEDGEKTAVFQYWNINNNGVIYKITKADVPDFTRETSITIANDCENVYTVDLPVLPELETPKQYGTVTYEISGVELQEGYYTDGAKVENGRLILPIQKNSVDTTGHVGTVNVTVKSTNYNDVTLTVNVSADNRKIPDVTAPTANTLTYNGAEQELVSAGKTTGGTMLYRCGDSEWSEKVPTAKDAGEYIVWYKIQGNTEYADVAEQSVKVTIAKKEAPVEVIDKNTDTGSGSGDSDDSDNSSSSSSGGSDDSDDSDNSSDSSSSGSRRDSNAGKDLGRVTKDPEKGQVSSEKGIITGAANSTANDGYSHWMRDEHGWWLRLADNSYPKAEKHGESGIAYAWEMVNGSWWAFDENGYIKTGWMRDDALGGWFYADPERGMQTGWVQINGVWYYFHPTSDGKKGIMYADRKTPDGYYVDENGAWDGKAK